MPEEYTTKAKAHFKEVGLKIGALWVRPMNTIQAFLIIGKSNQKNNPMEPSKQPNFELLIKPWGVIPVAAVSILGMKTGFIATLEGGRRAPAFQPAP